MSCDTIRNELLALPSVGDLGEVPEALAEHLAGCPACLGWQAALARVEAGVRALPVPTSDGVIRARVIKQFRPSKSNSKAPALKPMPARATVSERLTRMWPAGLIAAAVLVGSIAWLTFDRGTTQLAASPADPLLEKIVKAKIDLDAAAHDPARKMQVLTRMGDDVHEQAQALALVTPGEDMEALAKLYQQIGDSLVEQAKSAPKESLGLCIEALVKVEREATAKATSAPVGSGLPLREIAKAARDSRSELAKRLRETS